MAFATHTKVWEGFFFRLAGRGASYCLIAKGLSVLNKNVFVRQNILIDSQKLFGVLFDGYTAQ